MTSTTGSPILVTGGTGTLGRHVVPRLRAAGHDVRVLSRHPHEDGDGVTHVVADLATGEGAGAALEGIEVVVHLAGSSSGDEDKARHLIRAASRAGVRHLVFVSVVGADRVPQAGRVDRTMFGYFGTKLAAERVVSESGIPWTTLRATQFHDLLLTVARQMTRLPVVPVPAGFQFQPVETDEVAARLVELASGPPAGLVPDIAGPPAQGMDELLRSYLRARGRRRPFVRLPVPGRAARALREGANLAPDRAVGHRTWEEFLSAHVADARVTAPDRDPQPK
jgi:uncharacterized protein YbjT (DUF2867 family)